MDESNEDIVNDSGKSESENKEDNLPDAKILEYFEEDTIQQKTSSFDVV
jgi:hypothetical protein